MTTFLMIIHEQRILWDEEGGIIKDDSLLQILAEYTGVAQKECNDFDR